MEFSPVLWRHIFKMKSFATSIDNSNPLITINIYLYTYIYMRMKLSNLISP